MQANIHFSNGFALTTYTDAIYRNHFCRMHHPPQLLSRIIISTSPRGKSPAPSNPVVSFTFQKKNPFLPGAFSPVLLKMLGPSAILPFATGPVGGHLAQVEDFPRAHQKLHVPSARGARIGPPTFERHAGNGSPAESKQRDWLKRRACALELQSKRMDFFPLYGDWTKFPMKLRGVSPHWESLGERRTA